MNVYTHYRTITPSIGFRWRTLLQFGDGWNIIGSVVMKNPGSAYFANEAPLTNSKESSSYSICYKSGKRI